MENGEDIFSEILQKYRAYAPDLHQEVLLIEKAYKYAKDVYGDVARKSGEPYILHPLEATKILMSIHPDVDTIVACILHDALDDGSGDLEAIEAEFGETVSGIIEEISHMGLMKYRGDEKSVERFQKGLVSFAQDVRVLFVKFADRIHNLQTLQFHEEKKIADRIALESLMVYAPVAARLGMYYFKHLLEDLAFAWIRPAQYDQIKRELADLTEEMDVFLRESKEKIASLFPDHSGFEISHRVKQPYSIYRKMRHLGVDSIRDVHDVFALRILTHSVEDCYSALGIIHGEWTPVLEKLDDYIGSPKPNGYQSLHTTIHGMHERNQKRPTEIQIRTFEMHDRAEYGTAAHFAYKEGKKDSLDADWLDHLSYQYVEQVRSGESDLLPSYSSCPVSVFVFTPMGDVKELPHDATVVDFAYSIHSDVGHTTVGARVNDRMVPITTKLKNGDLVEIVTDKNATPSLSWLEFVVTNRAKNQITIEHKRLSGERDRVAEKGKELIDAFLQERWGEQLDERMSQLDIVDGASLDDEKKMQLLYLVGMGRRKPSGIFRERIVRERPYKTPEERRGVVIEEESGQSHHVIIGGQKNMQVHFAGCCEPKYPASITGVIRRDGTCSVHRDTCLSLARTNPERHMGAYWQIFSEKGRSLSLRVISSDTTEGMFGAIVRVLYGLGVNILEGRISNSRNVGGFLFRIEVSKGMEAVRDKVQTALESLEEGLRVEEGG